MTHKSPWGLHLVAIVPLCTAIACVKTPPAYADDLAISFDLSPQPVRQESGPVDQTGLDRTAQLLRIPAKATAIPVGASKESSRSLPPPPPNQAPVVPDSHAKPPLKQKAEPAELKLDLPSSAVSRHSDSTSSRLPPASVTTPLPQHSAAAAGQSDLRADWFEGGSDSLVARAVGSAEGTRTPDGHRTRAYYGHVDPGNGVWNLGSFSYQHGATSPEEADAKQLARLRRQSAVLQQQAASKGLELTLEEALNGIDLANQAPRAALDRGGYVDWLYKARRLGLSGPEAVVWARTRSFLDPDTQRWDAPGLGNSFDRISHDQERRQQAIARALDADRRKRDVEQLAQTVRTVAKPEIPSELPSESAAIAQLFAQKSSPQFPEMATPSLTNSQPVSTAQANLPATEPETVDLILNLDLPQRQ